MEDLLAKRGIIVSYETIRLWFLKFGPEYARQLKRRQSYLGDTWFLDEVFVTINGERQYLWRAVDQDGDVIDILVQSRRNRRAAERFFRKLLKGQGRVPFRLVTDRLKSYGAALRTIMPSVNHDTGRYLNIRMIWSRCNGSASSSPLPGFYHIQEISHPKRSSFSGGQHEPGHFLAEG